MARSRKPQSRRRGYARRAPSRTPGARILVVCQGDETEPRYLRGLRADAGLGDTRVPIQPSHGLDPKSLVLHAAKLAAEEDISLEPRSRDQVWCVFDKDDFPQAEEAAGLAKSRGMHVALSVPCVELWFLLHFRYTTARLTAGQASSSLRKCPGFRRYGKSCDAYPLLRGKETVAIGSAEQLRRHHEEVGSGEYPNPWTNVDELVTAIRCLAPRPGRRQ